MEEQLIEFETADIAEKIFTEYDWVRNGLPTQSLLQKWLREEHKIFINIETDVADLKEDRWIHMVDINNKVRYIPNEVCGVNSTYEEALEKGLIEALKLV